MAYAFLQADWDSDWAPVRDFLAALIAVVGADVPGLVWLYIVVEELGATNSAFWVGPTPTGEMSVVVRFSGAIVLSVLWLALVLALFGRPLVESYRNLRATLG